MSAKRAPCAADPRNSRGRLVKEAESAFRSCFQRDRDRIIHSSAFRRLKQKTQVFVESEGDLFRTRLTHSLEVAQVARTVAGALGLDQELSEAVALAHDLGHTPFGHTGEDALEARMAKHGGFDHNAQAIRIVTSLERHYVSFDGLNLTWETLEGLAKHNGPVTGKLPWALAEYAAQNDLELGTHASAEAQVAALADDVAYNNHDLQDGLRAGVISDEDVRELPIVGRCYRKVEEKYPGADPLRMRHEALRRVFGKMVKDLVRASRKALDEAAPQSSAEVRNMGRPAIRFSDGMMRDIDQIHEFLFERMYRAPKVVEIRKQAARIVEEMFDALLDKPELLPPKWLEGVEAGDRTALARTVSDYISGMTDRFAQQEHARITGREIVLESDGAG